MAPHATPRTSTSLPSSLFSLSVLSTLLLTFPAPSTAWDCKDVLADSVKFNFGQLAGEHVVHWEADSDWDALTQSSYNFTLNLCQKLDTKPAVHCHPGTRVCAIREDKSLDETGNSTIHPIDIAGTYTFGGNGRSIDAKTELLRNSPSNADAGREGVRVELHGGRFPFESKKGLDQRAIIEFVCDKDRTGLEGLEGGKDGEKKEDDKKEEDGGEKKEEKKFRKREDTCEDSDNSLRFCSYKLDKLKDGKEVKTLRLDWRTKYACEDAPPESGGSGGSGGWGFFTWFIIILFLAIASYLIFGSWLNYNRYGARGWDLLPHGDTIRDIPYVFKDWARSVKDTMQGSGSRGGYSAV
ncbi:hypothetical protein BU24DRAFT_444079 [Aaosphaeria arxii CBS 175.79]|uniref:Autophagy-related protein 27 n=1 Tax=Aaosphaeria arxii CBS 175.79 TaxID=1450172 RepID=A0A6A5XD37_9PLEO|nr:uncharacterized protein BU24DRAFT_444079 [Aaosphaeria arxii CBS 175.79]KAF2010829.1 hypothetical protein BU24DRAFT_444079 [Aaosphaeria arxii CBS 175.79]